MFRSAFERLLRDLKASEKQQRLDASALPTGCEVVMNKLSGR